MQLRSSGYSHKHCSRISGGNNSQKVMFEYSFNTQHSPGKYSTSYYWALKRKVLKKWWFSKRFLFTQVKFWQDTDSVYSGITIIIYYLLTFILLRHWCIYKNRILSFPRVIFYNGFNFSVFYWCMKQTFSIYY